MYLINKVSKISGVSVRTLHHYDEIGLLSPRKYDNGYRYYTEEDLTVLQAILFYKYLGFPLKEIKKLLSSKEPDILSHLEDQLKLMQAEKERLLTLIDTLEKTIKSAKRRKKMSVEEKFKGFTYNDNKKYEQEAVEKYGKDVIEKSLKRHKGKEAELTDGLNKIFFGFSGNKALGLSPEAKENIELAKELHEHICKYSFDCSKEAFSGIGLAYVENKEFKNNIDRFGEGTAEYACTAIQKYVSL